MALWSASRKLVQALSSAAQARSVRSKSDKVVIFRPAMNLHVESLRGSALPSEDYMSGGCLATRQLVRTIEAHFRKQF